MRRRFRKFFGWLHKHDGGKPKVSLRQGHSLSLENERFFPIIIEYVNKGKKATIPLRGNSMRPFLESERDLAVLTTPDHLKVGDPVLAEITPGHYVLHRIWKQEGDNVTLMGDGNLSFEYCKVEDFRAGVIGFFRKGSLKLDRTDGLKWKVYSRFWVWMTPIRRWLLAAYRYIWLNIFPLRSHPKQNKEALEKAVEKYGYIKKH